MKLKYSDREIIIHNKGSAIPLNELLKNAWAFVSNHSTAGLKAMIEGFHHILPIKLLVILDL